MPSRFIERDRRRLRKTWTLPQRIVCKKLRCQSCIGDVSPIKQHPYKNVNDTRLGGLSDRQRDPSGPFRPRTREGTIRLVSC